jgi:AAA family ATP:ADP antiporter
MLRRLICQVTEIREEEVSATFLSFVYFFCILCGYYILRPLREEMGLAGGVRNLPWMFQATLLATFLITPLFGWCVGRFPRAVLIPIVYRVFAAQILIFWFALIGLPRGADIWIGRVFYVWLSVFNMFVVSVFWAFVADGIALDRSKRLFGFIAAGGSLGAFSGAFITANLVESWGRVHLLLLSVVFLELAVRVVRRLGAAFDLLASRMDPIEAERMVQRREAGRSAWKGPWAGAFNGIGLTIRSPYLVGISGFLFLYSLTSTILYFQQAHIVEAAVVEREARAALFARIDVWVNLITLMTQLLLSGRIIGFLGVGGTLVTMPVLTLAGFVALWRAPVLGVLVVFQVLRRAANYALVRPARETLFTIVRREEKYRAKSFIDTFVYRGGDAIGSAAFDGLLRLGLGLSSVALLTVPVSVIWGGLGWYLGRQQTRRALSRSGFPPEGRVAESARAGENPASTAQRM